MWCCVMSSLVLKACHYVIRTAHRLDSPRVADERAPHCGLLCVYYAVSILADLSLPSPV